MLSVSPSTSIHQTISTVDSNLVTHDNKKAATEVVWLRQEKKERLSSTDRSVFASWHRLLSAFVV